MKVELLKQIINLFQNTIDEYTNQKALLLNKSEEINIKIQKIDNDKIKEIQNFNPNDLTANYNFAPYFKLLDKKKQILLIQQTEISKNIEVIDDKIIEVFKERRKIELLLEEKLKEQKKLEDIAEAKELDEIALRKLK